MLKNKKKFIFVIPARMESSRLFGKPLLKIGSQTLIEHVYLNATKSKYCSKAIIATDSKKIYNFCVKNNLNVALTGKHNCASNRVAEVARKINTNWIVELQGDEPFLNSSIIDKWIYKCLRNIKLKNIDLFLSSAIIKNNKNFNNRNIVKLIKNNNNKVLWFSRSIIPCDYKKQVHYLYHRHTGFHLWKKSSLIDFSNIRPSLIEKSEDTHALRLVENNFFAKAVEIEETLSIDTRSDLIKAKKIHLK